jgi:transposase InsO family protein
VAEGSWVKTLHIEPGSPWENGYIESFNGKLRNELLKVKIFTTLFEAQVMIESWTKDYIRSDLTVHWVIDPLHLRPFYRATVQ